MGRATGFDPFGKADAGVTDAQVRAAIAYLDSATNYRECISRIRYVRMVDPPVSADELRPLAYRSLEGSVFFWFVVVFVVLVSVLLIYFD